MLTMQVSISLNVPCFSIAVHSKKSNGLTTALLAVPSDLSFSPYQNQTAQFKTTQSSPKLAISKWLSSAPSGMKERENGKGVTMTLVLKINKRRQRQPGQNREKKKDTLIHEYWINIFYYYICFNLWTLLKKECSRFIVFLKRVMHRNLE